MNSGDSSSTTTSCGTTTPNMVSILAHSSGSESPPPDVTPLPQTFDIEDDSWDNLNVRNIIQDVISPPTNLISDYQSTPTTSNSTQPNPTQPNLSRPNPTQPNLSRPNPNQYQQWETHQQYYSHPQQQHVFSVPIPSSQPTGKWERGREIIHF
jgi:hypothetical protein